MFRLFTASRKSARKPAFVPQGVRVYAIGDVHGRADLLAPLHAKIVVDAAHTPRLRKHVIYLGDYIDRGPSSREVVEILLSAPLAGFSATHLLGNHEAMLLRFLDDAACGPQWFAIGGTATLLSYGVAVPGTGRLEEKLLAAQRGIREKLPTAHRGFLSGLPRQFVVGDYMFVHAGVRPGVPLERQDRSDLVWIRKEFLDSPAFHGKVIVHGHSFGTEPEILPNRIGIDTGAYATGKLTCVVLEGQEVRLL
ncbi:MAG TPA: metallophosphoesterase family protein [Stellaceae bacterium]|nr:metallophosphoesterase family protein [Stellaceae bacterium]